MSDNWWTAGAVKAWELNDKSGSRWRKLPDGKIELGYIDCDWVESTRTEDGLDSGVGGMIAVTPIPIPDWAAGYDRAAERDDGFKVREKNGLCWSWFPRDKCWRPDFVNQVLSYIGGELNYTPVPTVLGGWPAPAPTPPVAEPSMAQDVIASMEDFLKDPSKAKVTAVRPVAEAERPWRAGDVLRNKVNGVEWYAISITAQGAAVRTMSNLGDYASYGMLDSAEFDNLGPHRMEPDGNGGLRFVKIPDAPPAPPQPDPDRPAPDVTPDECVGWSHVYWHRNGAHRFAQTGTRWVAECRYKSNPTWDTTGWASPDELKSSAAINPDLADGFVVIKEPSQPDKLTRSEYLSLFLAMYQSALLNPRDTGEAVADMAKRIEPQIVAALHGRRP